MLANPSRIVLQLFAPLILGLIFWTAMIVVCFITGKVNRQTLLGLGAPSLLVTLVLYSMFWQKQIVETAINRPILFIAALIVILSSVGYVIVRNWARLVVLLGGDLDKGVLHRRFVTNNSDMMLAIWGGANLLGVLILSIYLVLFR